MSHRRRRNRARAKEKGFRRTYRLEPDTRRMILWASVIAVAAGLVIALLQFPTGPDGGPSIGGLAPDFTVVDIDGRSFRLSEHRDRVVLIDFMGSRCSTCVQQMQFLPALYRDYAPRGLAMISIDVGGSLGTEDPGVARDFMAAYGGTWPVALDNSGIGLLYRVSTLPTLYLIQADGTIAFRHAGVMTDADLAARIKPLL